MKPVISALKSWSSALMVVVLIGCIQSEKDGTAKAKGPEYFPQSVEGLADAISPTTIDSKDGDTLILTAAPVKKTMLGRPVRMLAYNGSIPGPTIRVREGSEIVIKLRNRIGIPTLLHSHGVRLDAQYDGTSDAQKPIADGDSFSYRIRFPDPGLYWYHPHYREDYAKESGLYGNFLVVPKDTAYWYSVDRETMLMLDDFYLDTANNAAPFRKDSVDRTMMGRFGNLFLLNGDTAFQMIVKRNEVVRFYATNACNTRVMNIGIEDPAMRVRNIKVVGSDNGQYKYFDTAASTLLAPAERKIFEAYFDEPGTYYLTHHILKSNFNRDTTIRLGRIDVLPDSTDSHRAASYLSIDSSISVGQEIDSLRHYAAQTLSPDKFLMLGGYMGAMAMKKESGEPISIEAKGIEWLDHMAAMNSASNLSNMHWFIRDTETNLENHAINWTLKRGAKVKIRIYNSTVATHPMPHPIHFHGQRFLILSVNTRPNLNMAWKDTYLIGIGETVEILLDASNPGVWMAQCHIAEHLESMMMFNYKVE